MPRHSDQDPDRRRVPGGLDPLIKAMEDESGEELFLTAAAATQIGVHKLTVQRWRRLGQLSPSFEIVRGQQRIPLYSKEDIHRGRILQATSKPGPQPGALSRS